MEFNQLSQLRQGNSLWRVRVYVSRLWQHRGGTDHGPIKHADLVLLDSHGNHMYAEIPEKNVDSFMGRIEEGKIYDLSKFLVFPRKYIFRAVEGHSMIKFTKRTTVVERVGMEATFPFCTYALTPLAHLPRPTDMPERFTDVIGMITGFSEAVQYVSASRSEPSIKRIIHLQDTTGHKISITLWGDTTLNFESDELMDLGSTEPLIAIFVGTLVKTYDGQRGLSGSAACRWYINEDLHDIREFRLRLRGAFAPVEHINLPGQSAAEVAAQDTRFLCTAVLSKLSPSQRWWFSSCTTCHKTSIPDGGAYRCSNSNCAGTDAIPRYRICYVARDDDDEVNDPGEAEFVFFDRVGRELIGSPLIGLLRHGRSPVAPLQEIVQSARTDLAIPRELAAVVSRKFFFVVSISNKCFTTEEDVLSFQVLRIDAPLGQQPRSSVLYRPLPSTSTSSGSSSLPKDPELQPLVLSSIPNVPASTSAAADSIALSPGGHTPPPSLPSPATITKPPIIGGVASKLKPKSQRTLFQAGVADPADDPQPTLHATELATSNTEAMALNPGPSADEAGSEKDKFADIDVDAGTCDPSLVDELANKKRSGPSVSTPRSSGPGKRGRNKGEGNTFWAYEGSVNSRSTSMSTAASVLAIPLFEL